MAMRRRDGCSSGSKTGRTRRAPHQNDNRPRKGSGCAQSRACIKHTPTMSTPETDSLLRKCHNSYGDERAELIHFCRKMERERDQARDRQWANSIHSCHSECARPMCVLRRERDEWREKAEHLAIACKVWEDATSMHPIMHCPDCKEFRGHGHECKSEPPQPPARNCRECCGQGQVEIQSGPYMRECTECNGTGKETNQPKP